MEKNSFTLAEILVAITIFIIILGIVIVRYDKAREAGQDVQRVKDLQTVAEALEKYYLKNNKYPPSLDSLVSDFLGAVPKDPQNQSPYVYSYCVDSSYQKYALMAKLKTKSQALETDYDKDWPDTGTSCDCNPGTGETDPENQSPYTYCIKNP